MEDPSTMEQGWEPVVTTVKGQDWTERLRVDTGYIYCRTTIAGATSKQAGQVSNAMTFVPDRATP